MTDERCLEILLGVLNEKKLGVLEEETAINVACLILQRKMAGKLIPLPPVDRQALLCAVVAGLAARGDVADEDLLQRAREIVDGRT